MTTTTTRFSQQEFDLLLECVESEIELIKDLHDDAVVKEKDKDHERLARLRALRSKMLDLLPPMAVKR